jgi:RNA polymerase sigma-70 factor (ECF subfamily)
MSRETELTDEVLLARIARGDLESFQIFYQRHETRVTAYARQLGRDPHLAEDVAQEVFTAVWSKAGSFRPERGNPLAWLYAMTRHRLIDEWRKRSPYTAADELEAMPAPEDRAEKSDLSILIRQALSHVAREQRRAIEMAYFGGLTYEETAGRLELPVGTLKSRIRVGLRAMRSVLERPAQATV